jgi:hypothetical protein
VYEFAAPANVRRGYHRFPRLKGIPCLFLSPTVLVRRCRFRKKSGVPGSQLVSGSRPRVVISQPVQLLGDRSNETLQRPHLFIQLGVLSLPLSVGDQSLDGTASQIRNASGPALLANAHKLTELVFGNAKVN